MAINYDELDNETPFVQILLKGYVVDVSVEHWENDIEWQLIPSSDMGSRRVIRVTDIYGCPAGIVPSELTGYIYWTPEGSEVYQRMHKQREDYK